MEEQQETLVLDKVSLKVDRTYLDEDGLISLWDLARGSIEGSDVPVYSQQDVAVRTLAARLLNFLAKLRYEYAVVSRHDVEYFEGLAERDTRLFADWSEQNERVDLIAAAVHLAPDHALQALRRGGFESSQRYAIRKTTRKQWFDEDWRVA